jgi:hypothetical protein
MIVPLWQSFLHEAEGRLKVEESVEEILIFTEH